MQVYDTLQKLHKRTNKKIHVTYLFFLNKKRKLVPFSKKKFRVKQGKVFLKKINFPKIKIIFNINF